MIMKVSEPEVRKFAAAAALWGMPISEHPSVKPGTAYILDAAGVRRVLMSRLDYLRVRYPRSPVWASTLGLRELERDRRRREV